MYKQTWKGGTDFATHSSVHVQDWLLLPYLGSTKRTEHKQRHSQDMFCFCHKCSTHSCSALLWGLSPLPVLKNALLPLWEISQPFEINLSSDRFYFYPVTHLTPGLLRLVWERTDPSAEATRCGRCEGSLAQLCHPANCCSSNPGSGPSCTSPCSPPLPTTLLVPSTTHGTCDTSAFRPSALQQWCSKGETRSPQGWWKLPMLPVTSPQTQNLWHRDPTSLLGSCHCSHGAGSRKGRDVPKGKLLPRGLI